MADRHDENLPEVVPDSSPQTLTSAQAFDRRGLDEGDQKYTVIDDSTKPKMAGSDAFMGDAETPMTPAPAYRPAAFGAAGAAGDGAAGAVAPDASSPGNAEAGPVNEKAEPRILGLKKRTFIIVLVIAIVVIAAAIGGGVGGSQAAKKSSSSAEDPAEVDEETLSPTSTTATPSSSSSPSRTSTSTSTSTAGSGSDDNNDDEDEEEDKDDDDPGFDFKGWEDSDFTGSSTDVITEKGFIDLPFNVTSYKWRPNDSDCCVTFCQGNETSVGWRCTDFEREEATAKFGRIFVGCGDDKTEENSRCS